jgi:hypothetical protein
MSRLAVLLLACALPALEVGDHTLADLVTVGQAELAIRGGGTLRWKRLFAIYDAGLWIDAAKPSAGPLDDVPKRLEFRYRRSISAADLAKATTSTLGITLPAAEREALQPRLDRLNALYRDVVEHDSLVFTYLPGTGTSVMIAGVVVDTIPGADFAHALFAIWLGPDPVDARFRTALLGTP